MVYEGSFKLFLIRVLGPFVIGLILLISNYVKDFIASQRKKVEMDKITRGGNEYPIQLKIIGIIDRVVQWDKEYQGILDKVGQWGNEHRIWLKSFGIIILLYCILSWIFYR